MEPQEAFFRLIKTVTYEEYNQNHTTIENIRIKKWFSHGQQLRP